MGGDDDIQAGAPGARPAMRVLVVATSSMAQAGMAAMVEASAGMVVAASVSPGSVADVARQLEPDVCLLDLEGTVDVENAVASVAADLECPLLVVAEVRSFREAVAAGAGGVLSPGITAVALAVALAAVGQGVGVVYPSQALAADIAPAPSVDAEAASLVEALTPRETEILGRLSEGMTNREVARALGISEHTAKFHVSAVLGKLGAQSRAEAVASGYRLGLLRF